MPGQNKTGPKGEGPKTGRGLGRCGPEDEKPSVPAERGTGRGLGRGQEQGRGRGAGRGGGGGRGRGGGRGSTG